MGIKNPQDNPKEFEEIVRQAYARVLKNGNLNRNKKFAIVCGPIAAGKTTFAEKYFRDEYVYFDGDELLLSGWDKRLRQQGMLQILEEMCREGYSISITLVLDPETGLENHKHMLNIFREKGYQIDFYVLACDAVKSWRSMVTRAEKRLSEGKSLKRTTMEKYDEDLPTIVQNVREMEESGMLDSVKVVDRSGKVLYDGATAEEKNAASVLEEIMNIPNWKENKPILEKEYQDFVEKNKTRIATYLIGKLVEEWK